LVLAVTVASAGDPSPLSGPLDFSGIAPATSVEESQALLPARILRVLEHGAAQPEGHWGKDNVGGFIVPAVGRLGLGLDAPGFFSILADPATKPYALVGTDFVLIPHFCERNGDYDFNLHELVAIAEKWGRGDGPIPAAARRHMLDVLFTEKGIDHHLSYRAGWCGVIAIKDTENHIFQSEMSRYLTNDLLLDDAASRGAYDARWDNEANGFNAWMRRHLQVWAQHDFEEFNSRPYQGYTVGPLSSLYSYASDAKVRTGAKIVLDWLAARYAVENHGLRRSVPFRRKVGYHDDDFLLDGDGESARFAILAGNFVNYDLMATPWQPRYGEGFMSDAAISDYRIPSPILDLLVKKDRGSYFQKFHHSNVEVFYSSPSFEISAGGVWVNHLDVEKGENDEWAVATTLMPAHSGYERGAFIRFAGHSKDSSRNNTCVAPGFACGLNPVIPDSIPSSCREQRGPWTFFKFAGGVDQCPLRYGFHAALYQAPCHGHRCKSGGGTWGFLEAVEATSDLPYAVFAQHVVAANSVEPFSDDRINRYITEAGLTIAFEPQPSRHWDWPISELDEVPQARDMSKWPLADGPIVNADGAGRITVHNPWLGQSVVMDFSDPDRPAWAQVND
jgi:hypothetical protein